MTLGSGGSGVVGEFSKPFPTSLRGPCSPWFYGPLGLYKKPNQVKRFGPSFTTSPPADCWRSFTSVTAFSISAPHHLLKSLLSLVQHHHLQIVLTSPASSSCRSPTHGHRLFPVTAPLPLSSTLPPALPRCCFHLTILAARSRHPSSPQLTPFTPPSPAHTIPSLLTPSPPSPPLLNLFSSPSRNYSLLLHKVTFSSVSVGASWFDHVANEEIERASFSIYLNISASQPSLHRISTSATGSCATLGSFVGQVGDLLGHHRNIADET
ncbi:hypothetical protein NL676_000448 [Syzygium grande]|nr:hypothetical protein NL676_000448 [Syzygium grande]